MNEKSCKSKHTAKVENHLHTNRISKPAILRTAQMENIGNTFEIKRTEI